MNEKNFEKYPGIKTDSSSSLFKTGKKRRLGSCFAGYLNADPHGIWLGTMATRVTNTRPAALEK